MDRITRDWTIQALRDTWSFADSRPHRLITTLTAEEKWQKHATRFSFCSISWKKG